MLVFRTREIRIQIPKSFKIMTFSVSAWGDTQSGNNDRAMLAALQPDYKHAEPTLIGEYGLKTARPYSARTSALLANNMQHEMKGETKLTRHIT